MENVAENGTLNQSTDIKTVIAWDNGLVTVFDSSGYQIPEYQGWLSENCGKILHDAREDAQFLMGEWGSFHLMIITPTLLRELAKAEAIPDGRH